MKAFNSTPPWLAALIGLFLVTSCAVTRPAEPEPEADLNSSLFDSIMNFYQGPLNHLAAVRRGSCPMYPSCSEYSRQAIAKHGFAVGWTMSMDRLMRCGRDEMKHAPRIRVNGNWLFYDPVDANAYWWNSREEDHTALKSTP